MKLNMVLAALVLSGFASVSNASATADPALPITSILFATQNVPKGGEIKQSDLTVHWIAKDKKPLEALETVFQATGLKAKYRLVEGQIVSSHDCIDYYKVQQNTTIVVLRLDNAVYLKLEKASLRKKVSINQLCGGVLAAKMAGKK